MPDHPATSVSSGQSQLPRLTPPHSSAAIYLLRTMQQHHVQLSAIADNKANIMIGVSAFIFSGLVAVAQREPLALPLQILGAGTLLAACAAVLAVMPKVKGPTRDSRAYNPLFFGCFMQGTDAEYLEELNEILASDSGIYTAMAMDAYGIGSVLYNKKYRWLMRSYQLFLVSLLASFIAAVFVL